MALFAACFYACNHSLGGNMGAYWQNAGCSIPSGGGNNKANAFLYWNMASDSAPATFYSSSGSSFSLGNLRLVRQKYF